jgi:hypothetical protein
MTPTVRYEYRRVEIAEREWEAACNALGAEGWRLFKMQQKWADSPDPIICFFVQEVPADG